MAIASGTSDNVVMSNGYYDPKTLKNLPVHVEEVASTIELGNDGRYWRVFANGRRELAALKGSKKATVADMSGLLQKWGKR